MNAPMYMAEVLDEIITSLSADTELLGTPLNGNIYQDVEDRSAYPVLVISGVTNSSTRTLNNQHVWRNAVVQITARDKGGTDKSRLVLIMRRVSLVLDGLRIQRNGRYIGPIRELRELPRGPDEYNDDTYPQIVVEYDMKAYKV